MGLVAKRQSSEPIDPDFPRFMRWWIQLVEFAESRPNAASPIDVDDIARMLDLRLQEAMLFIDWLCETRRAYNLTTGSPLGRVCLQPGPHGP